MSDFNLPEPLHNIRFILLATITCKKGHSAEMQTALAKIRALSDSDKEPRTFTYRTCVNPMQEETFIVFEEYAGRDGLIEHTAADPFQELSKSGLAEKLDIQFFKEFI